MSYEYDLPEVLLDKAPDATPEPLSVAIAALAEIVGEARIRVAVHNVPLAIFAREDVKHQQTLINPDGSAFVTADITVCGHNFGIFSATETPS